MDVTSLLNSSSAALQRRDSVDSSTPSATGGTTAASTAVPTPSPDRTPSRRTSGSRSPHRNRTPWDAGGYSLPLSLDTKAIQTASTARPVFYCESPTDGQSSSTSPKSPKHKFSDSRSSLSSYASSNNSVSHSRISSLSTVSEFQPLTNLITEITLNGRMSAEKMDNGNPGYQTSAPARSPPISIHSISGDDKPSAPVIYTQRKYSAPFSDDVSPTEAVPPRRPGSPSDAVIIRRGPGVTGSPSNRQDDHPYFKAPSLSPESSLSRAHKRAVSAPDFPAIMPVDAAASAEMPPSASGSAAGSAQGSSSSDHENNDNETNTGTIAPLISNVAQCEFVGNCNTGSQLRKVISHFFGRNKLCTRVVPEHIWVHVCRKHYQRARYRNAVEYAKLQCTLIRAQIDRVQAWSNANKEAGHPDVMKDWSVAMRKREQERLDKQPKRKRQADEEENEYYANDANDDDLDTATVQGRAFPEWLATQVGTGYSSDEILDIVKKIEEGLENGALLSIPDIEFLPNLIKDERKSRGTPKRRSPARAHTRSRSMGVHHRQARDGEGYNMGPRRESQPDAASYWDHDHNDAYGSPAEKRPRLSGSGYHYADREPLPSMVPRNPDHIVPTMQHMSRRQSTIEDLESRFANDHRARPNAGAFGHGGIMSSPMRSLPPPTPTGMGMHLAPLPETPSPNNYHPRSMHARSQSDAGSFYPTQPYRQTGSAYTTTPTSEYTFSSQGYQSAGHLSSSTTPGYPPAYTPQPYHQFYQQQTPTRGPYGHHAKHTRHLSTPVAQTPLRSETPLFVTPSRNYEPQNSTYLPIRTSTQPYQSTPLPSISQVEGQDQT
ncbi:hypothetical protein QBC37DRAFT_108929 [Rhypophila decipiens]|uniref:Uncharacterized protein n=1 Tax=Rhypophila decipiens TaxID=261697 RepID=A0AAN6YNQ3_9PEZI|nr:hypothetical protein QBC37DRAFT_108929 [Rhypophila decipiens]